MDGSRIKQNNRGKMNSKCCNCGVEISDEEKEKVIKDFSDEVFGLIEKYGQMPDTAMAAMFISIARDMICNKRFSSYTFTIGMLQEMLTDGLKDQWESYHLEEEEENAPNSL